VYTNRYGTDPAKQFELVAEHIARIRRDIGRKTCRVFIFVERNLGYEAEHHKRALGDIPGVSFYIDQKANRVGVLTTEATKHAMATLVVSERYEQFTHTNFTQNRIREKSKGKRNLPLAILDFRIFRG